MSVGAADCRFDGVVLHVVNCQQDTIERMTKLLNSNQNNEYKGVKK